MEPTSENIKALVAKVDQQGGSLTVTFSCPITGTEIESRSMMRRDNTSLAAIARRSVIQEIIWSIRRQIFQLFGRGITGRVARDVGGRALHKTGDKFQFSKADKDKAIMEAFQKVQTQHFVWDPQTDHWVHKSAQELV